MDKLQRTIAAGLNGGHFLVSALAPCSSFFLVWSFKSKRLKVVVFSVGSNLNRVWSDHSFGVCGRAHARTQGTSAPHGAGVSGISPIKSRQQRRRHKQGSQNTQLKSNLKAVTFTLITKLIQILSFLYSLNLWNFSSITYWLKNKHNQQPPLTHL